MAAFVPAHAEAGEIYHDNFADALHALRSRLYETDMVAARMLTHLMGHVHHKTGGMMEMLRNARRTIADLESPRGIVWPDGKSATWNGRDLNHRTPGA